MARSVLFNQALNLKRTWPLIFRNPSRTHRGPFDPSSADDVVQLCGSARNSTELALSRRIIANRPLRPTGHEQAQGRQKKKPPIQATNALHVSTARPALTHSVGSTRLAQSAKWGLLPPPPTIVSCGGAIPPGFQLRCPACRRYSWRLFFFPSSPIQTAHGFSSGTAEPRPQQF